MQTSLTKKLGLSVAALAMVATSLFTASDAEAVPSFARQTGMSCNSCHFQSFPALNGMGRSFRAGNYTMKGAQTSIEGENIDLPSTMGMSAVWKTYHIKKDSDEVGTLAWPDEAAFLVGGRLSSSVGYLWEIGLNEGAEGNQVQASTDINGDGVVDDSDVYVDSVEGGTSFLSTKVGFTALQSGSMTLSVIPYSTDALGSAYGFELMNTATQRSQRAIEKRHAMSAAQDLGIGIGAATGIALVASDLSAGWWANLSLWGPSFGEGIADPLGGLAQHIRVGYFFDIAGFDSGVALLKRMGTVKTSNGAKSADGKTTNLNNVDVKVGGQLLDFQMQGQVAGNDLGIYVTHTTADNCDGAEEATADKVTVACTGVDDTGYVMGGASGIGVTAKYSITPKIQAHFANTNWTQGEYKSIDATTGAATTVDAATNARTSMGVDYKVAENVTLQLIQYTSKDGEADAHSKTYMGWFFGL